MGELTDHDLLIRMDERTAAMHEDIQEVKVDLRSVKQEVNGKFKQMGRRIRVLENWRWYTMGVIACAVVVLRALNVW